MRPFRLNTSSFVAGLGAGVAAAVVAVLAIEATRHLRARRARALEAPRLHIDGARPADPLVLDSLPLDARVPDRPLASEAVDMPAESQRW